MLDYGQDVLIPKIKEEQPDVFGVLLDTFMVVQHGDWFLNSDFSPARSLFYFPSDGEELPLNCERVLQKVDYPVAMSKFGQQQVKRLHDINAEYIPHAVHPQDYRPLSEEERLNLKARYLFQDKFVVGSVYRNQGRKMADLMFKSFAIFAKSHPDAVMLLHTDPHDIAAIFDVSRLSRKLEIQNRIVYTGMKYFKGFDYKDMNNVYNTFDAFMLSTSGEGFGIPTIEAMSCEIPVIITDYTTTKELVKDNDAGIAVKTASEVTGNWNVERGIWDVQAGVDALEEMYNHPDKRKQWGRNGRQAVLRDYNWSVVGKQWEDLLEKIRRK